MLLVDRRTLYDVLEKVTFVLLRHTVSGEKAEETLLSLRHATLRQVT